MSKAKLIGMLAIMTYVSESLLYKLEHIEEFPELSLLDFKKEFYALTNEVHLAGKIIESDINYLKE